MSVERKDGGPAFPTQGGLYQSPYAHAPMPVAPANGMTLRDHFAGQAMLGMTASPELMEVVSTGSILDGTALDRLASRAYQLADAMLAERSKP